MSLKNFVFRFQWCIVKWFLFLFYLRFTRLLEFLSLRFIHDKFFLRALSSNEMPAPRIQCGPAWSALLPLGGTLRAALPLTQWAGSMSRYHYALVLLSHCTAVGSTASTSFQASSHLSQSPHCQSTDSHIVGFQ